MPAGASEFELERHVAAVAPVVEVGLPRGRDGRTIGVAFVVLADPADAARVVRELDGVVFQGPRARGHVRTPRRRVMGRVIHAGRTLVVGGLHRNATALEVRRHVESAGVEVECLNFFGASRLGTR